MPDHAALERNGIKVDTLRAHWGGYRTVSQYFHITIDSLVPFFLAIAIQTAANPYPLRLIKRNCLVPHPLDEHQVIVDWCKLKKAQRRSFDRRRRYAAPNLIERSCSPDTAWSDRSNRSWDPEERCRSLHSARERSD